MESPASAGTACLSRFVDSVRVILPLCPFPPIGWWRAALSDGAVLDAGEHYQKRSFRNRLVLMASNGVQTLTMPVERRGGVPRPQDEVALAPGSDSSKLWRAVITAYGSAPFFEEMAPELEALFLDGPDTLGAWNRKSLVWASGWLGISVPKEDATASQDLLDHEANLMEWCDSGAGSAGWPHIWDDRRLDIPYHRLSCLDVLLHCGPEARGWVNPRPPSGSPRRG